MDDVCSGPAAAVAVGACTPSVAATVLAGKTTAELTPDEDVNSTPLPLTSAAEVMSLTIVGVRDAMLLVTLARVVRLLSLAVTIISFSLQSAFNVSATRNTRAVQASADDFHELSAIAMVNKQESRAVAREPRDAAAVVFGLKFALFHPNFRGVPFGLD